MRLNLSTAAEPYELFEGVVIHARPALTEVIEEARSDERFVEFALSTQGQDDLPDDELSVAAIKARSRGAVIFAKAIARQVIESWEGVEDPDGSVAPVTIERVEAFMDNAAVYQKFTEVYLARWLTVQAEKKDLPPSQSGTSGAAPSTAKPARKSAKTARKG